MTYDISQFQQAKMLLVYIIGSGHRFYVRPRAGLQGQSDNKSSVPIDAAIFAMLESMVFISPMLMGQELGLALKLVPGQNRAEIMPLFLNLLLGGHKLDLLSHPFNIHLLDASG